MNYVKRFLSLSAGAYCICVSTMSYFDHPKYTPNSPLHILVCVSLLTVGILCCMYGLLWAWVE